jgi:RHS repeat-associated protein
MNDQLVYTYKGNQLLGVNDISTANGAQMLGFSDNGHVGTAVPADPASHEYLYDANGNMYKDYNKEISLIEYNHLNLPKKIYIGPNNRIDYTYDAVGIKLQQKLYNNGSPGTVTDYDGNFVYVNGALSYIGTDEGRLIKTSTGFDFECYITDHLGNTRVVVNDKNADGVADIIQERHYYPFGMEMAGQSYDITPLPQALNKYLYNGKEFQDDFGLGLYDYGARFYDAQLGRWHSVDPLAEKYPSLSPYNYCINNPIKFIDPNGMEGDIWIITGDIEQGKKDAQSMLPDSYKDGITVDEKTGEVGLKPGYDWNSCDPGVELVKDLVTADETIELNVADEVTTLQYVNGEPYKRHAFGENVEKTYDLVNGKDNYQLVNASKTQKSLNSDPYDVPKTGADGQVTIAGNTQNLMRKDNDCTLKPRASLVFHELKENYLRTVQKQSYDVSHSTSKRVEMRFNKNDPRRDYGNEGAASNSSTWYK